MIASFPCRTARVAVASLPSLHNPSSKPSANHSKPDIHCTSSSHPPFPSFAKPQSRSNLGE
ncbi:uncharacterized protein P884DRAFT_255845 [Thermothelomyces heterothallicus CBS 202.75]|uniref:uncharacterized protein n=1 Tax=Thermothelomyces heterothallicus CBS 202.75 TaxID=1149848 RepID=UPI0037427AD9